MPFYWVAIHHPDDFDPAAVDAATVRDITALNRDMIAAGVRAVGVRAESAGDVAADGGVRDSGTGRRAGLEGPGARGRVLDLGGRGRSRGPGVGPPGGGGGVPGTGRGAGGLPEADGDDGVRRAERGGRASGPAVVRGRRLSL